MEEKEMAGKLASQELASQEAVTLDEAQLLKPIMEEFMAAYAENHGRDVAEWLPQKLQSSLDISLEEAQAITRQLAEAVAYDEEATRSLDEARMRGVTREAWVSRVIREEVQDLPEEQQQGRLSELYADLGKMNAALMGGKDAAGGAAGTGAEE